MGIVLAWSSTYPGTIDTVATNFPTVSDGVHDVISSHVNSLSSAVVALQNVSSGFLLQRKGLLITKVAFS